MSSRSSYRRALLAGVVGTTASVLPGFMTGAVAVQLADDIGLGARQLGFVIGTFFASAALGSALLGRLAEQLGATRAMRAGLTLTVAIGLSMALARTPLQIGLILFCGGLSNALTQPAANLLLAARVPADRLGIAFAVKQAGMPIASLIGGLAVPAIALTLGWQATYVVAAAIAGAALLAIPSGVAGAVRHADGQRQRPRPDLPIGLLARYGVVGLLGAAAAGVIVTFLVTAAEDSGVSPALAGLLLTGGSALGVTSRLLHGRWADGPGHLPIRRVILLLALGGVGAIVLAVHSPITYLLGVPLVFAAGWAWPGLFNLSVVRHNPSAPAAATGVTQTGIYIGAGAGPVLGGLVVGAHGFSALWLSAASVLAAAALLGLVLRRLLRHHRTSTADPSLLVAGPRRPS